MNAEERKTAELRAKIESLSMELSFWRDASKPGGEWEKHHSQIRRVAAQVDPAVVKVESELQRAIDGNAVLVEARRIERLMIDLHSVWEFFRGKLLISGTEPFKTYLAVADEFAWACYQNAVERIDPLLKEPPLTFFKTTTSPYAMPRDHSYQAAIDNDRLRGDEAVALLKSLPIPVIAIPWFQSRHLPDLLIVAHETGHHVEDLGLTRDLEAAIEAAPVPTGRKPAWRSWMGETFADVFATLAAGPAFTSALVDFLTSAPATVAAEQRNPPQWGLYPTSYLRILLSAAVLRQQGFSTEADEIEQRWRDAFPGHAMQSYETDCPIIAAAIVTRKYHVCGGWILSDIVSFSTMNQRHALAAATSALDGKRIDALEVRELAAGAALAFATKPAAFTVAIGGASPQQRLLDQMIASRKSGTRSGAGERDLGPHSVIAAADRDKTAGDALYDRLAHLE